MPSQMRDFQNPMQERFWLAFPTTNTAHGRRPSQNETHLPTPVIQVLREFQGAEFLSNEIPWPNEILRLSNYHRLEFILNDWLFLRHENTAEVVVGVSRLVGWRVPFPTSPTPMNDGSEKYEKNRGRFIGAYDCVKCSEGMKCPPLSQLVACQGWADECCKMIFCPVSGRVKPPKPQNLSPPEGSFK